VLAALGEAVWSELVVVHSGECAIDGMVICALDDGTVVCALDDDMVMCALNDGHCLFFLLEADFVDLLGTIDVSGVEGDMI
jgi:hypothetical protein